MERDRLPDGWKRNRIAELAEVVSGATPKTSIPAYWNGGILWATPKDLGRLRRIEIDSTERTISQTGLESCSARLLPPGSVLLTSRAPIGHLAINTKPICTNQGFKSLIPKKGIFNRYLYWVLKSRIAYLQHRGRGGTFDEISKGLVESFEIPVPPIDEQRRIVARIEELTARVETARRLQSEAMGEITSYLPNSYCRVYQRLLDEFDTIPLAQAGQVMGGGTPSKENPAFWGKGVPWVSPKSMKSWWIDDSTDHITPEALQASAAKLIPSPAVLFVVRGMILARNVPVAVSTKSLAINQDMKAIVPREDIDAEFLASMMRGAEKTLLGQVEVAGHGTRKLETDRWGNLPIPVPPKPVQRNVVRDLNVMQTKAQNLAQLQAEIDAELDSFTPALLAKAFRGAL